MRLAVIPVLLCAACFAGTTIGGEHGHRHDHHDHAALPSEGYTRARLSPPIPEVALVDSRGEAVALRELLATDRPVILNFIYTTCTTVCPVLSATLAESRSRLVSARPPLYLSITIDPEHDTPARLAEYAKRYGAGEEWRFLTGSRKSVRSVQRAFGAYRGDKWNHVPLTFLRRAPDGPWLRLEGFTSAAELAREFEGL